FVGEREGDDVPRKLIGQPRGVLYRLDFDAAERVAGWLRLDDADRLAGDVEEVIGEAVLQRELADGDPEPRRQVQIGVVLDVPAAGDELAVDVPAGLGFGHSADANSGEATIRFASIRAVVTKCTV